MKGLAKLTWLEIKIFLREPLGVLGSVGMPIVFFFVIARLGGARSTPPPDAPAAVLAMLPVLGALLIAVGAGQSLVAVISIYREGGILKRLRATPLRPVTILSAHVIVKLLLGAISLALMIAAAGIHLSQAPQCRSWVSRWRCSHGERAVDWVHHRERRAHRLLCTAAGQPDLYPMMALALAPIEPPTALQVVTASRRFSSAASRPGSAAGDG